MQAVAKINPVLRKALIEHGNIAANKMYKVTCANPRVLLEQL
jgi:hypothetical protein